LPANQDGDAQAETDEPATPPRTSPLQHAAVADTERAFLLLVR
jgi:hypothetical protein